MSEQPSPTPLSSPAVPPIPSLPATIYFYGADKSGGDAPIKQLYIVKTTKRVDVSTGSTITEGDPHDHTISNSTDHSSNPIATGTENDSNSTTSSTTTTTTTTTTITTTTNLPTSTFTSAPAHENSDNTSQVTTVPDDKGKKRAHEKPTGKKAKKQRVSFQSGICLKIASGEACPYGEKCKYSHDPQSFLASKEADIGDNCYMFSTYGFCPYGLSCRYGSAHIKDFKHIVNEELLSKAGKPSIINSLKKETQAVLRRDRREFPKSAPVIKKYATLQQTSLVATAIPPSASVLLTNSAAHPLHPVPASAPSPSPSSSSSSLSSLTTSPQASTTSPSVPAKTLVEFPPELDVETRLRPAEKKQVDFRGKLYLAPLTTNGNLPFRRICKNLGADITCGEMALTSNLLKGQASEWALLRRHPSEDIFGIQIAGAFVDQMTYCAELIEQEDLNVDFVDINSGCPIDLICNKGMGSALLDKPRRIEGILRAMSEVLTRPLTIKLRTGRDDKSSTAHKLIPSLKLWGADAVTLHGRTRVQRYSKVADWDYINTCAQISPIPLIGNGDIYNWQEAVHYMENTSIASVMIARSAIIKPWIFTEIKERRDWDISATERFEMLRNFTNYGLEHWGSDTQGVEKTRNFLLNWVSFLCRYIPVGLLERLPSRINERPSIFHGRSDLETLLGSKKVADWVKLSEMLLGRVPADFHFEPKHKSNSYEDAQG